jgi:hypothetical protein
LAKEGATHRQLAAKIEYGPIAQLGERYNGIVEVVSSSLTRSTKR